MSALHPSHRRAAAQPVRHMGADSIWLGGRPGLRASVRSGVRLEPDPRTDPRPYPTALLNRSVRGGSAAATDPRLGVSPWGINRHGGARL
jgi:hypothetical protein